MFSVLSTSYVKIPSHPVRLDHEVLDLLPAKHAAVPDHREHLPQLGHVDVTVLVPVKLAECFSDKEFSIF